MKTAKLYVWVRTPSDSRDVASSTACAEVDQRVAVKLARLIDRFGNYGAGEHLPLFRLPEGHRLASGHGVTVVNASGRAITARGT